MTTKVRGLHRSVHRVRPARAISTLARLTIVAAVLVGSACTQSRSGPDLVLHHAVVRTMDARQPLAEAVAIADGRITFVGSDSDALKLVSRNTRVIDAGGRLLLPGFIDTHVHPVQGGLRLGECDLHDIMTRDSLVRAIVECAHRNPTAAWVRGGGFELPLFLDGNPSRLLLDSLVPDRPAFLTSTDEHNAWANSRALALSGVTRDTKDPPNGRIERDAAGNPSGTLREAAQGLVASHLPAYTDADDDAALAQALALAGRFGITTWHEANADDAILRAYHRADSSGTLTVRTVVALHVDPEFGTRQIPGLDSLRRRYSTPLVQVTAAKIFVDGVIEGHTAALLQPYLDRPGFRGQLKVSPPLLDTLVHALDSAGFKVHVHAIGDRAIRVTLDAFEKQHAIDGGAGPRHIIAHLQLFDPADIPRLAALGVAGSFQPLWAFRDTYMRDLTEPRLGPRRSRWQYPIASVVRTGAIVAAGSDWPVTSMDPLQAIQVAVTRQRPTDSTDAPFFPEERVDVATAVGMYTSAAAMAVDQDSLTGTITVGKAADLIVLSENVFTESVYRIARTHVVLTLMGGREVFRDSVQVRP